MPVEVCDTGRLSSPCIWPFTDPGWSLTTEWHLPLLPWQCKNPRLTFAAVAVATGRPLLPAYSSTCVHVCDRCPLRWPCWNRQRDKDKGCFVCVWVGHRNILNAWKKDGRDINKNINSWYSFNTGCYGCDWRSEVCRVESSEGRMEKVRVNRSKVTQEPVFDWPTGICARSHVKLGGACSLASGLPFLIKRVTKYTLT